MEKKWKPRRVKEIQPKNYIFSLERDQNNQKNSKQ